MSSTRRRIAGPKPWVVAASAGGLVVALWLVAGLHRIDPSTQFCVLTGPFLSEGARVKVWNTQGEVEALCRLSANVRPGVAWMPYGGMFDAGGKQRSVNVLTDEAPTDWGGGSGLYDAFVEVALLAA